MLGRLEKVAAVRDIWPNEARDFIPWLAKPDNLAVLAQALEFGPDGLEYDDSTNQRGGPPKSYILCRETGSARDTRILIDSQFGQSDHDHVGKLLTHASATDAQTVILVGEKIRDKHRNALNWLNAVTGDKISFYACEIELWRIGDSLPAPRLNIVVWPDGESHAKPHSVDDPAPISRIIATEPTPRPAEPKPAPTPEPSESQSWATQPPSQTAPPAEVTPLHTVEKPAANQSDLDTTPPNNSATELGRAYQRFWEAFNETLVQVDGDITPRKPAPKNWMDYPFIKENTLLRIEISGHSNRLQVGLHLQGRAKESWFSMLEADKSEIEGEFGTPLDWDSLPHRQSARISTTLKDADPSDESDWPRQHHWLAKQLQGFQRAFGAPMAKLDRLGA